MRNQLIVLCIVFALVSSLVSAVPYHNYPYDSYYGAGNTRSYESYSRTYDTRRSESRTESHDNSYSNSGSCYSCYGYTSRDSNNYHYTSTESSTETIRYDTYQRFDDGRYDYYDYSRYYPRDPHDYRFYDTFGYYRRFYQ